jgi:hypothetical protein
MSLTYSVLRSIVLEYLRKHQKGQVNFLSDEFRDIGKRMALHVGDDDLDAIEVLFHEMYLERIIVSGKGVSTLPAMTWPLYRVTEYGKRVLASGDYVPHDSSGYLQRISSEIPGLDDVIIRYLEEALGCFRSDFLLAASVMIGCAAEKAVLILVDAFGKSLQTSGQKQQYEKDTKSWMISKKYEALWNRLEPLAPKLPKYLSEDLHVILDRIFELIRTTRNEAGHPTGRGVGRDTVYANLMLFPTHCRRVYGLIDYFDKNPIPR